MKTAKLIALPPVDVPSPITALMFHESGVLWAGGVGGIAAYDGSVWTPRASGLPLTTITALASGGEWIIAAGTDGIARTDDAGRSWQPTQIGGQVGAVTALAISPDFKRDNAVLAATMGAGVLRSEDAGATWAAANFGIQSDEVLALLWTENTLIAGAVDGLYLSPNGGRAWKLVHETPPITALTLLPDGTILAALETGGLLISADKGRTWTEHTVHLPTEGTITDGTITEGTITALSGSLIGTNTGVFALADGGGTWDRVLDGMVFALTTALDGTAFASVDGRIALRDSKTSKWQFLPFAPVHDLRKVIVHGDDVLIAGRMSGMHRYHAGDPVGEWKPISGAPIPLTLLTKHNDALYASGVDGLFRSRDGGQTWQALWQGAGGHLSHLAFQSEQIAFGSRADGAHLVRTTDGGATWQVTPSPFGILPVLTLEATDEMIFAGVYDPRRHVIALWRSTDGGARWMAGAEIPTGWALAASFRDPAMIALSNGLLVSPDRPTGAWTRAVFDLPDVRVRRITGDAHNQFALSLVNGVFQSEDRGGHWRRIPLDLRDDEIMDIHYNAGRLALLLVGGRVFVVQ